MLLFYQLNSYFHSLFYAIIACKVVSKIVFERCDPEYVDNSHVICSILPFLVAVVYTARVLLIILGARMITSIDYPALIDIAMHSIVKRALDMAVKHGLPGNHHFFISFLTYFPGVKISEKLMSKYPEEMTIVLQYQFDDLRVYKDSFSVVLSFDNEKERITVPFMALTAFADPSVKFGLQFRHIDAAMSDFHDMFGETVGEAKNDPEISNDPPPTDGGDNVISFDKFQKKKQPPPTS
jgi:hypothetical protein